MNNTVELVRMAAYHHEVIGHFIFIEGLLIIAIVGIFACGFFITKK